jgi:hypothetical protein
LRHSVCHMRRSRQLPQLPPGWARWHSLHAQRPMRNYVPGWFCKGQLDGDMSALPPYLQHMHGCG